MDTSEWDEACCAIVDKLCDQPPHGQNTADGPPHNYTVCGMYRAPGIAGAEAVDPKAMADTMRWFHAQGYTASTHDLQTDFSLYRNLMRRLGVPVNLPGVLFFHGSATPPEQLFDKGVDLARADPDAFAGPLFYGSVAAKAASYARPYLYLYMLPWPDAERRTIAKPRNRDEALHMARDNDVLIMGSHTASQDTGGTRYFVREGDTQLFEDDSVTPFAYPELAIRDTSRLIPLACFLMDGPGLSLRFPELDGVRRKRLRHDSIDYHFRANQAYINEMDAVVRKRFANHRMLLQQNPRKDLVEEFYRQLNVLGRSKPEFSFQIKPGNGSGFH
jgi:hypothetical protein